MIVGSVCFATHQGIAHLARDFYRNGVIDRMYLVRHSKYRNYPEQFPEACLPGEERRFLEGLDVLLYFESALNWQLARTAAVRGIKTVVVPMYEYSPHPWPGPVHLYACPSLLDLEIYRTKYPHVRSEFLNVPVDKPWKLRETATRFVHNAGHGQHDLAKGTLQVLEAMKLVSSPIVLTVRGQPEDGKIGRLFNEYQGISNVVFEMGDTPEEKLYDGFDVFVNAEKFNGLSLPLQEAYASGMLVMTSNRFPANSWLPTDPLIPVERYEPYTIATTFERAIVSPKAIAEKIDEWYNLDIRSYSLAGKAWGEDHSWKEMGPKWRSLLESEI